jgi:hypothetical protein
MTNKTNVLDFSTTGHHYHNHQLALHFCAILGAGTSAGSSTGTSAGSSARMSAKPRNMMRFSL